jgi:hypothetical protein
MGWWFGSILFIIVWVAIAFWPARVAARKGHSFFGYFLFSLVFFPAALRVLVARQDGSRVTGDSTVSAGKARTRRARTVDCMVVEFPRPRWTTGLEGVK